MLKQLGKFSNWNKKNFSVKNFTFFNIQRANFFKTSTLLEGQFQKTKKIRQNNDVQKPNYIQESHSFEKFNRTMKLSLSKYNYFKKDFPRFQKIKRNTNSSTTSTILSAFSTDLTIFFKLTLFTYSNKMFIPWT